MLKASAQTPSRYGPARAGAVVGSVMALAFGVVRLAAGDRNPILGPAEGWILDDAAFVAALAVPAVVAVLAVRRRPALLLPAGILSALLALSPIVWTLPLAVPAVLYLVGYTRARTAINSHNALAAVAVVVLGAASLGILLVGPHDTVCWTHRTLAGERVVFERDHAAEAQSSRGSISQSVGPPAAGEIASGGGCTDGAIPPRTSLAALSFAAAAFFAGRFVTPPARS